MYIQLPSDVITNFRFDPERHDFIFSGDRLKTGMRVLLEDSFMRCTYTHSETELKRVLETARWCTVGEISIDKHPDFDEEGNVVDNKLVSFEAIYDDGRVMKRCYNASYAWYAEKPIGEYAQIVRDGLRRAFPDLAVA